MGCYKRGNLLKLAYTLPLSDAASTSATGSKVVLVVFNMNNFCIRSVLTGNRLEEYKPYFSAGLITCPVSTCSLLLLCSMNKYRTSEGVQTVHRKRNIL